MEIDMTHASEIHAGSYRPTLFASPARGKENAFVRPLRRYLARRRTIAALSRLDDHMLADIGLARADIPLVASHEDTAPAPRPSRALWADVLASVRRNRRRRATIRALKRLPDYLLEDIGIPRWRIEEAVETLFTQPAPPVKQAASPASPVHDLLNRLTPPCGPCASGRSAGWPPDSLPASTAIPWRTSAT